MAWFKVDDGFYTSQKVLRIPREHRHTAIGAWIIIGTWSADNMTDGIVPSYILDELGVSSESFQWLVETGLWYDNGDGIEYHDWCEYQPTKAQLQAKHEVKVAAGQAGGLKSAEARRSKREANVKQQSSRIEANGKPEPEPEPIKEHMFNDVEPRKEYSDDFESWWESYPRKQAKGDAWKAWKALKKALPPVQQLIDASIAYGLQVTDPQFQKMAGPWLRARRWEDIELQAKQDNYTGYAPGVVTRGEAPEGRRYAADIIEDWES